MLARSGRALAGCRSATSLNGSEAEILPAGAGQLSILACGIRAEAGPAQLEGAAQSAASARARAFIVRLYSRTSCKVVSSTTSAAERRPGVA